MIWCVCKGLQNCIPPDRTSYGVAFVFVYCSFETISPTQVSITSYDLSLLLGMF